MKKLLFFAAALLFSAGVSAQETKTLKEDGIKMKNGKVWVWENGQSTVLTSDRTLSNGTKVSANGTVTNSDGTVWTLVEGDKVNMEGVAVRKDSKKAKDAKMK